MNMESCKQLKRRPIGLETTGLGTEVHITVAIAMNKPLPILLTFEEEFPLPLAEGIGGS